MPTELQLRRLGCVFEYRASDAAHPEPFLHASAPTRDVGILLRDEVKRRVDLFFDLLSRDTSGASAMFPGVPLAIQRSGRCYRCGDALESHRGGDCYLCVAAIRTCRKRGVGCSANNKVDSSATKPTTAPSLPAVAPWEKDPSVLAFKPPSGITWTLKRAARPAGPTPS